MPRVTFEDADHLTLGIHEAAGKASGSDGVWKGSDGAIAGQGKSTFASATETASDAKALPESSGAGRAVLPWSVNLYQGTYRARIYWPKPMWETITRELGHVLKLDPKWANDWTHCIGRFSTAHEARAALEAFIRELPPSCHALKATFFAYVKHEVSLSTTRHAFQTDDPVRLGPDSDLLLMQSLCACCMARRRAAGEQHSGYTHQEQRTETGTARGGKKAKTEEGGTIEAASKFRIGDHVFALFGNGKWYRAVLKQKLGSRCCDSGLFGGGCQHFEADAKSGRWVVDWDDGDDQDRVKGESELRLISLRLRADLAKMERDDSAAKSDDAAAQAGIPVRKPEAALPSPTSKRQELQTSPQRRAERMQCETDAKGSSVSGSCVVLPWSVNCRDSERFFARIQWPKSLWESVKKLGFEFRPQGIVGRGTTWKHRVEGTFGTAEEAREALDSFIEGLRCSELKLQLFA